MSYIIWLFLIPFLASCVMFIVSNSLSKKIAFFLSLIPLGLLLFNHANWLGTSINYPWFPALSIHFHLGIDALSLLFLYLVAILIPMSILADRTIQSRFFFGMILLLQGLLIGFFTARDLALFTFFWEAMLIPLYFIMSLWGGMQRQMAALKFLIYMIAGSVFMIAALLSLYFSAGGTFDMEALKKIADTVPYVSLIGAAFFLAFAVKAPLFPFHGWLPDAYTQASTGGSILLAGLLSKAGIYGFMRIGTEFFPSLLIAWSPFLLGLAIIGVLYGGMAAWAENDYKRLIAYSSFSHVNFILAGIFAWSAISLSGSILQAFNHGITITALFLVAGWLEERLKTTSFGTTKGLAKFLPHLCWLTLFFVLSSVALPGLNNFVGEFLIFFGLFPKHPWLTALLGLTVILSVMYMLRWIQEVYFESPSFYQESWIDIKGREFIIALPLIFLILWIGIYPEPFLKQIQSFVSIEATP